MSTATTSDRVTEVANMTDPLERVAAAQALVGTYEDRSNNARSMRDNAAIVAHLRDGVPAVVLYRDTLDVSRGLFNKIVARAPHPLPKIDDPVEAAREAASAVRRNDEVAARARVIRDETALLLMSGGTDPVTGATVPAVSNAEIARVTGLTTARVAQIRTGSR